MPMWCAALESKAHGQGGLRRAPLLPATGLLRDVEEGMFCTKAYCGPRVVRGFYEWLSLLVRSEKPWSSQSCLQKAWQCRFGVCWGFFSLLGILVIFRFEMCGVSQKSPVLLQDKTGRCILPLRSKSWLLFQRCVEWSCSSNCESIQL